MSLSRREALALGAGGAVLATEAGGASRALDGFKATEFVRRPTGVDAGHWLAHWQTTRGPLLRSLPGVTRAALNIVSPTRSPGARYDGAVELWFRSAAAYRAAIEGRRSPDLAAALAADTAAFQQPEPFTLLTRTANLRSLRTDDASGMAKRIGLVGREPGVDRATFHRRWRDVHAPEVLGQYGLEGYALNMVTGDVGPSTPWDGFAELWWTDWAAFDEAVRRGSNGYAARANAGFFHSHLLLYVTQYG